MVLTPMTATLEQSPAIERSAKSSTFTLRELLLQISWLAILLALFRAGGTELLIISVPAVLANLSAFAFIGQSPRWCWQILATTIVVSVIAVFLSPLDIARGIPYRQGAAENNLKQVGIALAIHESAKGNRPPITIEKTGGAVHSWRSTLLDSLGRPDIAESYDWDEAWDGPNNAALHQTKISTCQFRYGPAGVSPTDVAFLAITVPGGYPDGSFFVVEVPNSGINFFEPRDISLQDLSQPGCRGVHKNGTSTHILWPDGSVELVAVTKLPDRINQKLRERRAFAIRQQNQLSSPGNRPKQPD
ncbi:DUF1559 domain-containing protein [Anatilimnocola sp. NA78]|uniref:DUF1559 family PulG-like putative transporter n=1 Tax=Anatilimnocola sp. NA78 TaxID=3415683 RepID=UPI003CE528F3